MCGIAGFLSFNNKKLNKDLLLKMQKSISHRGPDFFDTWQSQDLTVGFAHSRLSIIDISLLGSQPMQDRNKTVVISFNGEIYNHLELRKKLEALGYQYFSNTDTETLIYAYQEWGINFLSKLDGMFAFSLYDIKKNHFYLVRDRIGIKPIYYSLENGIFSFASEIKALWQLPWLEKKINNKSVYDYLTFMVTPAPDTIYKNVNKLESGSYLFIDDKKNINKKKWYSQLNKKYDESYFSNEKTILNNIEKLLIKSVEKRMMSDVPVGVFLSGGLDSSLITSLMSKFSKKIKTFTVAFKDGSEFNELKWARIVADKFKTEHYEILISEKEAFEFYESMVYQLDEPLADPVCIPFYFVSKLAKDNGIKVVQVGEGADELFFGYPTYFSYLNFYNRYWKNSQKFVPDFIKRNIYKISKQLIKSKSNHLEIMRNWSEKRALFWSGAISFNEYQKQFILNDFNYDSFDIIKHYLKDLNESDDFIKKMTYLELKLRLPELLLMRADKMSMLNSLEVRVPFLDYKLVEYMLNLGSSWKIKNNQTKYLLKKVAEKYLPKDIIYRKKVGFASPVERWFNHGKYFKKYYSELLTKELHKESIFKLELVDLEKLYDHHSPGLAVQKWTLQNILALKNIKNENINC